MKCFCSHYYAATPPPLPVSPHPPLEDEGVIVTAHHMTEYHSLSVLYTFTPVFHSPFHKSAFSLGPLTTSPSHSGPIHPHSPIPVGLLAVMLPLV